MLIAQGRFLVIGRLEVSECFGLSFTNFPVS